MRKFCALFFVVFLLFGFSIKPTFAGTKQVGESCTINGNDCTAGLICAYPPSGGATAYCGKGIVSAGKKEDGIKCSSASECIGGYCQPDSVGNNVCGHSASPFPAPATTQQTPAASTGAITSTVVPGTSVDANSGLVQCGRPGQNMCTLCDFFSGMNFIIQYIMKISVAVGLAAFTIAGVVYVVSAGDSGTTTTAKNIMKNAGIGFVVIFAGWLIVNYTITVIGTRPGMGINVTSWGQFDCASTAAQHIQTQ